MVNREVRYCEPLPGRRIGSRRNFQPYSGLDMNSNRASGDHVWNTLQIRNTILRIYRPALLDSARTKSTGEKLKLSCVRLSSKTLSVTTVGFGIDGAVGVEAFAGRRIVLNPSAQSRRRRRPTAGPNGGGCGGWLIAEPIGRGTTCPKRSPAGSNNRFGDVVAHGTSSRPRPNGELLLALLELCNTSSK
jgi:hypothetical protein